MNRNFGISILILCFGLSGVNASLATQVVEISPIIVQPYEIQELNQQMLDRDRQTRDEEIANLIALTEEADAMTSVRGNLESKSGLLAEKYQMLTELKDEMTALNEKLKGEGMDKLNQKEAIIEGYKKITQQQKDKIQMLVGRQDEMNRNLARAQSEASRDQVQVGQLGLQLSQKQTQLNLLKAELENKINELYQKEQQAELLNTELKNKIAQEKNQSVLEYQKMQAQAVTLRRQLADQQIKVDLLKQELDSKTAQSAQMTLIMSDYQKKLESRNNAYNEQLRQVLSYKNNQTQMEGQIADLSARLQAKEAQVVKIKKDMYDLQKLTSAKDRETQAKDLNLSTELALARQELKGMPSRDEIDFLRTGLKKAALQLKQKDEMLLQIKANADEYAKEFKKQSQEFQSLKVQLQSAYEEIKHKNENLKYVEALQAQLKSANAQIKDLQAQLNQLNALSKGDRLREKLKQALDEIDEQGRVVNVLVEKLHEAGQSVNLTSYFAK